MSEVEIELDLDLESQSESENSSNNISITESEKMSNSMSITSSDTSSDDLSICNEIELLINRFQDFHTHIHNSFETLQTINSLIINKNNINVTYDGWKGDFDELLEKFHLMALNNIKEKGENNFGDLLINALGSSEFN